MIPNLPTHPAGQTRAGASRLDSCPDPTVLAALPASDAGDRAPILEHLSRCPECRAELAGSMRERDAPVPVSVPPEVRARVAGLVPTSEPISRTTRSRWLLAAAAVVAVGFGGLLLTSLPGREKAAVRSVAPLSGGLVLEAPADGATADSEETLFTWSPRADALRYRLVVVDASGRRVVETTTRGPSTAVSRIDLGDAAEVHWWVEARLGDGSVVTSTTHRLRLAPLPAPPDR